MAIIDFWNIGRRKSWRVPSAHQILMQSCWQTTTTTHLHIHCQQLLECFCPPEENKFNTLSPFNSYSVWPHPLRKTFILSQLFHAVQYSRVIKARLLETAAFDFGERQLRSVSVWPRKTKTMTYNWQRVFCRAAGVWWSFSVGSWRVTRYTSSYTHISAIVGLRAKTKRTKPSLKQQSATETKTFTFLLLS